MAVCALISGRLSTRYGLRRTATAGIVLVLIGYVVLFLSLDADHYARGAIGLVIAGCGFGLLMTPLNGSTLSAAESEDYGAAASTTLMIRLLGMTVGISALTAFGIKRLQSLTDRIAPVVREPNESTASYLARQQQFIVDHAIPLSVQVLRETFLIAAVIALLALIPISLLAGRGPHLPALLKRSSSRASATD
jgi:MFS family permease